jgi:hypothetical protein
MCGSSLRSGSCFLEQAAKSEFVGTRTKAVERQKMRNKFLTKQNNLWLQVKGEGSQKFHVEQNITKHKSACSLKRAA